MYRRNVSVTYIHSYIYTYINRTCVNTITGTIWGLIKITNINVHVTVNSDCNYRSIVIKYLTIILECVLQIKLPLTLLNASFASSTLSNWTIAVYVDRSMPIRTTVPYLEKWDFICVSLREASIPSIHKTLLGVPLPNPTYSIHVKMKKQIFILS